jgi:VanZ family protein
MQTETTAIWFCVALFCQIWFSSPMLKPRAFLMYWLPLVLWMLVIFGGSGDSSSFQHSSRIIGPLVHWLFPALPDEKIRNVVVAVRKCAHLTEYAVLAWLFWRARRQPLPHDARPWRWPDVAWALLFCAVYAATDEVHQTFVPNRQGAVSDVFLDSLGAAAGLLGHWLLGRWRKRW